MNDIKLLWRYLREHRAYGIAVAVFTISGAVIGAVLGAMAYYNGWLG